MHIPFLVVPGFEADDVMATVSASAASRGLDVFLCTADKDCRQLVTEKVKILNLRKPEGELLDAAGIQADWGVRPDQVIDFQSLVGDSVDNIPGVPGVGPKTAAKWLQQFGTLENVIAHADEVAGGPKTKQALKDAIANGNLAKSRQLVALSRDVPLKFDWDGWRRKDWDGQRLLELFHEFGFRSFADRVRKTLTTSGAKKNEEVLETAGLASTAPSPAAAAPLKQRSKQTPRTTGTPSLFGQIDGNDDSDGIASAVAQPESRNDGWKYDGYKLVDTPAQFEEFLSDLKKQKRFVFDLETMGLNPITDAIVGYAFSWETGDGVLPPRSRPEGRCETRSRRDTRRRSSRSSRTRPSRR